MNIKYTEKKKYLITKKDLIQISGLIICFLIGYLSSNKSIIKGIIMSLCYGLLMFLIIFIIKLYQRKQKRDFFKNIKY